MKMRHLEIRGERLYGKPLLEVFSLDIPIETDREWKITWWVSHSVRVISARAPGDWEKITCTSLQINGTQLLKYECDIDCIMTLFNIFPTALPIIEPMSGLAMTFKRV